MFDKLRKKDGYQFDSVDLGRVVTTDGNERIVAQVDRKADVERVSELAEKYGMTDDEKIDLLNIAWQCHGMIHIFAPHQMEVIGGSRFSPESHPEDCTCNDCGVQECKVILNGREAILKSSAGGISYEMILKYLGWLPESLLTVTYHHKASGSGGSLTRGKSIEMQEGLVINAYQTGHA